MLVEKKVYTYIDVKDIFELNEDEINILTKKYTSYQEAEAGLDKFKTIVQKSYRKLCFKYHPDHGGNSKDFIILKKLFDYIMNIRITKIPPVTTTIRYYYNTTTSSTTYYY